MATKKQKREAAQARREAFLEEVKTEGLKAQRWDRERRERKRAQQEAEAKKRKQDESLNEAIDKIMKESILKLSAAVDLSV